MVSSASNSVADYFLDPVNRDTATPVLPRIIGIHRTAFGGKMLFRGTVEFRSILEMVIHRIIVPALPFSSLASSWIFRPKASAVPVVTKLVAPLP